LLSTPRPHEPHEEIVDGTLYRRIPNDHAHWKREEAKPTKYNFTPDGADDYLSMQLSDRVTPTEIFEKFPGIGLLEIETNVLRGKGLRVTYEPADGADHVAVWGLKGPKNALRRDLCEMTIQLWEPGTSAPLPRRDSQV
jgi:hypothetical protein